MRKIVQVIMLSSGHLYFTVNLTFKDSSCWYIDSNNNRLYFIEKNHGFGRDINLNQFKKIVATSDTKSLGQISLAFLNKFNKEGRNIKEVELEYELYCNTGLHDSIKKDCNCPCSEDLTCGYTLKLTSNNEVIVHLIEEKMYTLNQVVSAYNEGFSEAHGRCCGPLNNTPDVWAETWIKNNLK